MTIYRIGDLKHLHATIGTSQYDWLEGEAKRFGISVSAYLRQLIACHIVGKKMNAKHLGGANAARNIERSLHDSNDNETSNPDGKKTGRNKRNSSKKTPAADAAAASKSFFDFFS